MIGGNSLATIEINQGTEKNAIGEYESSWIEVITVNGFLDLMSGDSKHIPFNAKIQESTHVFICDYHDLKGLSITSENSRIVIDDQIYQVQLIDDPMNLHQHLEVLLKYVGGQNG